MRIGFVNLHTDRVLLYYRPAVLVLLPVYHASGEITVIFFKEQAALLFYYSMRRGFPIVSLWGFLTVSYFFSCTFSVFTEILCTTL